MPYFPYQTQNRVENIKKKFENASNSDEDKEKSPSNGKTVTLPSNTKLLQELKALNIGDKYNSSNHDTLETDSNFEKTETIKSEGKVLVRRSPAFRREKLMSSKSVTNVKQSPPNDFQLPKNLIAFKNDKIGIKTEPADRSNIKQFKRCNTDINLLRNSAFKKFEDNNANNDKVNTVKSTLISRQTNLLAQNQNKFNKNEVNDKILAQYSVVNKRSPKKHEGMLECKESKESELKWTDSIKLALSSPLPKGPPPKKPPRTFLHTQNSQSQNVNQSPNEIKLSKPSDDSPKLKLKLEKLEKIVRTHDIRSHNTVPRQNFKDELERKLNKMPETKEHRLLPNSPCDKENNQTIQSCLQSLNCTSSKGCVNSNVYEKLLEKQSEFFVNMNDLTCDTSNDVDRNFHFNVTKKNSENVASKCSAEPIYDLPYHHKGKNFKTFGKGDEDEKSNFKNKKSDSQLHYMCTDLVKTTAQNGSKFSQMGTIMNDSLESTQKTESKRVGPCGNALNRNISQDMLENINQFESDCENCDRPGNLKINKDDFKIIMNQAFGSPIMKTGRSQSNASSTASDSDSPSIPTTPEESNAPLVETCTHIIGRAYSDEKIDKVPKSIKDETLSQLTAKRKRYVKRVSSKLSSLSLLHFKQVNKNNYNHLFEYCLLVGLTLGESKHYVPYIKSIFPAHVKPEPNIESLCFPDASDWPPSSENQRPDEQYYSLVVTNENGDRKFGYCRRVLPEGGHFCLPLVYCIISQHRANGFYYKVLEELESRHGSPGLEDFIKQLYECEFPGLGQSLKLSKILEEATRTSPQKNQDTLPSTLVRRPYDIRLEEQDLTQLLEHLEVPVFLKVFSSLLLERKVLLISNSLRKLSSCIEALQSILVPFSWQHAYIPVLPSNLVEMCDAPTPYVIGLLKPKNGVDPLKNTNFEEGIIVDLEGSRIVKCCGDEGSILPPRFTKALKTALNLATSATEHSDSNRNVLISEAFIRFFVEVCGSYSNFLVLQPDGKKEFEKEKFMKSVTSPTTQSFLEWFSETAMFHAFIQERVQFDVQDLFRRRAMEHSDEMEKNTALLLKNYKAINRKVKTLGDRIKDLTSFSK